MGPSSPSLPIVAVLFVLPMWDVKAQNPVIVFLQIETNKQAVMFTVGETFILEIKNSVWSYQGMQCDRRTY